MKLALKRGNSSIFVCPFEDCQHICDADIQAACSIALKGYLKDIQRGSQEEVDFFDFVKELKIDLTDLIKLN